MPDARAAEPKRKEKAGREVWAIAESFVDTPRAPLPVSAGSLRVAAEHRSFLHAFRRRYGRPTRTLTARGRLLRSPRSALNPACVLVRPASAPCGYADTGLYN